MTKVLSIGVHNYDSPSRVGAWYYTRYLAKYCDSVSYIHAPLSPFHIPFLYKREVRKRFASLLKIKTGRESVVSTEQLFSLFPAGPMWPFNTALAIDRSYFLSLPKLKDKKFDLVYCDNPYMYSILRHVEFSSLVVRVPDILPPPGAKNTKTLFRALGWLMDRAELIIAVSEKVKQQIKAVFNKDALVISNGVDISRFDRPHSPPEEYKYSDKHIVYVGAFDYWLDVHQIALLSKRLPDAQIHLIGEANAAFKRCLRASNIHFKGSLLPEQVVSYLKYADVGIIPFDIQNHQVFVDGINPLKAYEYLAAGVPVVSTDFAGVRDISPYITTASAQDEFCRAVVAYLESPPDRDSVKRTAEPYDWSVVLRPFEDFVKKSLTSG